MFLTAERHWRRRLEVSILGGVSGGSWEGQRLLLFLAPARSIIRAAPPTRLRNSAHLLARKVAAAAASWPLGALQGTRTVANSSPLFRVLGAQQSCSGSGRLLSLGEKRASESASIRTASSEDTRLLLHNTSRLSHLSPTSLRLPILAH